MESEVININTKVSQLLWETHNIHSNPLENSPKIIFPKIRDSINNYRVSEQEARFIYSNVLNQFPYYFSVETPTEQKYGFSGNGERAASTDLTLYKLNNKKLEKFLNVEFKAQNPSYQLIEKDIQKMVFENTFGNWFHLLENIDSGTLNSLFKKFIDAFQEEITINRIKIFSIKRISLIFCFCILKKKFGIIKHFSFEFVNKETNYINFFNYVNNFFKIGNIIELKNKPEDSNNWIIYKNNL